MQRTREEQGALREELSEKEMLLEKAENDIVKLRDSTDRTVGALQIKMTEERAGLGELKGELLAAKAARRRSESQARRYHHNGCQTYLTTYFVRRRL